MFYISLFLIDHNITLNILKIGKACEALTNDPQPITVSKVNMVTRERLVVHN